MSDKIIYFDMDGVLADFDKAKGQGKNPDGPFFYFDLEPIERGIDLFKRLKNANHTVLIASTAPWSNPEAWKEKRLWVEKHLQVDSFKSLILTHRKDLLIGDILIDDRTVNGAGSFKGLLIQLGSQEFPTWDAVELFLDLQNLIN